MTSIIVANTNPAIASPSSDPFSLLRSLGNQKSVTSGLSPMVLYQKYSRKASAALESSIFRLHLVAKLTGDLYSFHFSNHCRRALMRSSPVLCALDRGARAGKIPESPMRPLFWNFAVEKAAM